ncbi:FHIPEP family type III secretion protein [Parablautia muri]|nr:FHIPEP family type III secretion protein [Parablautia muri]
MKENMGEVICQYRQNLKMTQDDFAYRLGVTPQAVSRWERGNGLPDLSLIKGICGILHISADTLLGISDNPITENNNLQMEQEIRHNLFAEPVALEFGEALIPYVLEGYKTDYLNQKRNDLAKKYGILMPVIRLRDNLALDKSSYRILSYDYVLREAHMKLSADESDITNPYYEMLDCMVEECRKNYSQILNKQLVKTMIDNLKELYPGTADGLVPEKISYLKLTDHLRCMLEQGKSIRDLIHILEEMERELLP